MSTYLAADILDKTLVVSSHSENSNAVLTHKKSININVNSSEAQALIIPLLIRTIGNFDDDNSMIKFAVEWWSNSAKRYETLFYLRKDPTNNLHRWQIRSREHQGSTYQDVDLYYNPVVDVIFLYSWLISEDSSTNAITGTATNGVSIYNSVSASTGSDYGANITEVRVYVTSYTTNDESCSVIMMDPWISDEVTGSPQIFIPPVIKLNGSNWTQLTQESGLDVSIFQDPGDAAMVPIDWKSLIEFKNTLDIEIGQNNLDTDITAVSAALTDLEDEVGVSTDEESCTGNLFQRVKCLVTKSLDIDTNLGTVSKAKTFFHSIIGNIFANIHTDEVGDYSYLGNVLQWFFQTLVFPWLELIDLTNTLVDLDSE